MAINQSRQGRRIGEALAGRLAGRGVLAVLLAWTGLGACGAQGRVFGIIGKTHDVNFMAVAKACNQAGQAAGDRCVLIGASGSSHPRVQNQLVAHAIASKKYAALAVSVTQSRLISATLRASTVPVITFDSPMEEGFATPTPTYVGIDNTELGRQLARIVKSSRPQGGVVCLFVSDNEVNIQQRVHGARQVLSGNARYPAGRRMNGEGGWTEAMFCPFDARDNVARSLAGLELALAVGKADVIIALGHWLFYDPAAYRKAVLRHQQRLRNNEALVVVAAGHLSGDQTRLVNDRLIHGVVSIDFTHMGQRCYHTMAALAAGQPVSSSTYTPTISLVAERPDGSPRAKTSTR